MVIGDITDCRRSKGFQAVLKEQWLYNCLQMRCRPLTRFFSQLWFLVGEEIILSGFLQLQ